jgi:PAS domain S-box-containing protein
MRPAPTSDTRNLQRLAAIVPPARLRGVGPMLMVSVNGLLLSIVSFIILHIFVTQTIDSDRHLREEDMARMIGDRVGDISDNFNMLTMLIGMIDDKTQLYKHLQQRGPDQVWLPFHNVVWFPTHELRSYGSVQIYEDKAETGVDIGLMINEVAEQYGRIDPAARHDQLQMILLNSSSPLVTRRTSSAGRVMHQSQRYIALVRMIDTPDGHSGLLMAVLRTDQLINMTWVTQRLDIAKIRLMAIDSPNVVLEIRHVNVMNDSDANVQSIGDAIVLPMTEWAQALQVQVSLYIDQQANMLAVIPYLMMLFGFVLTALGTLYVRNNQKQSGKLASMNRTLALKNMELNSQVLERERLNQTLRKTERENRAIIDSVTDIIFETDTDGKLLFLNDSWRRVTGYDGEASLGKTLFDLLNIEDIATQKEDFVSLIRGQKAAYRFITRLQTAGTKFRTVEIGFSMLRLDENKNMRVVGTITDVEERRRAEAALGEAERKYRTIWENAASGIYQVTPEGQLLTVNPAMAHIFGYDSPNDMMQDVRNAHRQLYVSLKDRQGMIRDMMMNNIVNGIEIEGLRKDNGHFWLMETMRLVKDDEGNILYFEGSIDDITKRKEAEFKLREAMLTSDLANRSKTEFLANMSHELRTPLNAIIGFSEIIRDEVFGKIAQPQYWEYAKDIHDSGKHLLSIINTILDVARIEAGDRQLNETLVNVHTLGNDVLALMAPKIEANQHQVNLIVPDNLPGLICEELAVKQILINLMSNAVKFTPVGGRITLSAEIDQVGEMRLAMTDTGVGLDAEEIERVMAPFGQATSSFSRTSTGAGLGLTLVNSLIKLHGGRIEMFSQKGIGTTVVVVFPVSRVRQLNS